MNVDSHLRTMRLLLSLTLIGFLVSVVISGALMVWLR